MSKLLLTLLFLGLLIWAVGFWWTVGGFLLLALVDSEKR